MAEPTTTTASAAWAVSAGLVAAFLAALGVTWVHVFWAAAGCFFGAGFAPPTGRWRAMFAFPISTMLSAKAGIIGAEWLGAVGGIAPHDMAQGLGALAGIVFHPMIAVVVRAATGVLQSRLGVQPENRQ
jgi:hypothetical protein